MRRNTVIGIIVAVLMVIGSFAAHWVHEKTDDSDRTIKVGFIYEGDESTPYTFSFIRSQHALESHFGDKVLVVTRSNVREELAEEALRSLVDEGCELVFATSYGYGEATKKLAQEYPEVQFCAATCDNANTAPVLDNYHTFMGEIYQGRYVSGIVAGMKLKEMIDDGQLDASRPVVGYVAAFPIAEVISGYTAFLLGVRSVVPNATMIVRYTNNWSSYMLEKACAEQLLDDGCVIISQHSDTVGPAVACENISSVRPAYSVGYNQSMLDVAPTTALVSTRVNWTPYLIAAVEAVQKHDRIEQHVKAHIHGNDAGAGFDRDWVQIVEINDHAVADGTQEAVAEAIERFDRGELRVFEGPYTGTDPTDPTDTVDLSRGYPENETSSAPTFHYVLDDIVTVKGEQS